MGTYNSGCAKIEVPVLNQDPKGPMLMVSHANTNPGLTKAWDPGEPEKFYPTGKRNYARVVTTDDYQGAAAADFLAKDKGIKNVYVLNDNQTYGQGVARSFVDRAQKNGIDRSRQRRVGRQGDQLHAVFQGISAKKPDAIYLAGIYDNNGGQLVKDKVAVLGDNTKVAMMGPDGFTGYPDLNKLPEAQGMYLTFAGLSIDQLATKGGPAKQLLDDYQREVRQAAGRPATRCTAWRRCRSSWLRSRSPTARARACGTPSSPVTGSPSRQPTRCSARRSRSTPPRVTPATRTSPWRSSRTRLRQFVKAQPVANDRSRGPGWRLAGHVAPRAHGCPAPRRPPGASPPSLSSALDEGRTVKGGRSMTQTAIEAAEAKPQLLGHERSGSESSASSCSR